MNDPKRRDIRDAETRTGTPIEVPSEAERQGTEDLAAIGGEPLEGSGFEEEEPEEEFL